MTANTRSLLAAALLAVVCHGETDIPRPTPAQLVWQDCEIGLLYCFDLAIAAEGLVGEEWVKLARIPAEEGPATIVAMLEACGRKC